MPVRFRRLILTTLIALMPLLLSPSLARAQAQDQPLAQAKPSVNLFGPVSPFLPSPAIDPVQAAQPTAAMQGSSRHSGVGIGAKIGPLFSSLSSDALSYSNRTGLIGGIFFGGNRPGVVGVMGEILYAKKGASGTDLYYLEIPVLLRVNIGTSSLNGVSVYVLGGPVADILLKGKQNGVDVKSNYESLDVGMKFGVGVEITRFLIELQENIGLRNILKSSGGSSTDIKSKAFAIMVGVRFN